MSKNITLFGGNGFLGRALLPLLAQEGWVVRVPTRSAADANSLKLYGKPGQIIPFIASPKQDAALAFAMRGADAVVNLIGILAEKRRETFQSLHVELPARIARIAHEQGIRQFVHISALGADERSPSLYARSKAAGEKSVQAFFPEATILRPSLIFGAGAPFFSRMELMARFLPFLPLFGGGGTLFQPVHKNDVARAIAAALSNTAAHGQTFELGGPTILSFAELLSTIAARSGYPRRLVNVPAALAYPLAFFLEFLPQPPLTRDQLRLLLANAVVSPSAQDFAALSIQPLRF